MAWELVKPHHRQRRAVIYVRQSTLHQVLTNQESLPLQYALHGRARALGWHEADIEVIDSDLGTSGAASDHRRGFKDLVARVTPGRPPGDPWAGGPHSLDRRHAPGPQLFRLVSALELCGHRECLIADRDGVYDPGTPNGRLLLGRKGTISELEPHTIRSRLAAGLLTKAERGELVLPLPVGLVRDASGVVAKTPDREVQVRIALVFDTFLQRRTAVRVVRTLHGIAWCGECGHKMTVRYKGGSQYVCNHLHQQHGVPLCQCLRSAAIEASVAAAFLAAVAPAQIDAWARARKAQRHADETLQRAEMQQIERLRYEARLAERQFNRVDPDNRLVAAELERRWETALCALRRAEEALARRASQIETQSDRLDPRLRAKRVSLGQHLPELWADPSVSREHRKALLRCLIDRVVPRRAGPDSAEVRIVWRGGEATELKVLLPVNAVAALPRYGEMEQQVLALARAGSACRKSPPISA